MSGPAQYWTIWGEKVRAPNPEVVKLQAGLMEKSFTWKEKRQIPGLTLGFNQQRAALMLACDKDIRSRLKSCGKLDQHGNRSECGVVFCPRCLMLRRGRQNRENIELFAHLGNDRLAFMTVLVRVIADLKDAKAIEDKFAWRVRNTIMGMRRVDPRWNNVMVKGYWEFDYLWDSDNLGRNTKVALPLLGLPTFTFGESHWLLHFHAIVALGDITIDELKEALKRKNAPHPYQVDVLPFRAHQDVNWNIKRITRYAMKFRIEDGYKRNGPFDPDYEFDMNAANERKWWPKESVGLLADHLSQPLHGYRSLQFWIGAKSTSKSKIGQKVPAKIEGDMDELVSGGVAIKETGPVKAVTSIHDLIDRINSKGNEPQS